MSKRRRQPSSSAVVVGVAWFDREQWRQLCEVAVDRALANLRLVGVNAEPFEVCVAELLRWCAEHKLPIDGPSRAEYVSFMLKRKRSGA